ncbi:uncharacterized protein L969DRAFT_53570 [Mixia osmundae IAM 14324]|uniref:Uncharacterized protein n=1 Tax=Mixia osmundae (strain CBS 9802 / IAM 14324 / JCM 22182 / KY 12970) TaxID=764103 RepID=G7EAW6_MIXOS|nr:uncharacterized protein L969DRAFT_53570 [Mixia osmundae IAM 14324]KEI37011.1 hypothetical protein L969DRAFT_53570 [Mixia osmundae IAM 14324]GAA99976.1 hypothetical protein E5Q_06679 [Mixia osmundae IAM 14324]
MSYNPVALNLPKPSAVELGNGYGGSRAVSSGTISAGTKVLSTAAPAASSSSAGVATELPSARLQRILPWTFIGIGSLIGLLLLCIGVWRIVKSQRPRPSASEELAGSGDKPDQSAPENRMSKHLKP